MIDVKKNIIVFFGLFLIGMLFVPPGIPFMIPEAEAVSLIETHDGTTVTFVERIGDMRQNYVHLGYGHDGTGQGQIQYVNKIDVDSSGNIYYTDHSTNRAQKLTSSGSFLLEVGPSTSADAHDCATHNFTDSARINELAKSYICGAGGIAVDSSRNIYVVAGWQPAVALYKFSSSGDLQWKKTGADWPGLSDGDWWNQSFSSDPAYKLTDDNLGIDIDNSGNIYIADYYNDRIIKLDSSGNF